MPPAPRKAPATHVVLRAFDRLDPRTGEETRFEVGDPYSGPLHERYLTGSGLDGRTRGPLIGPAASPEPLTDSTEEN
jgi:hypothetical protein